MVLKKLISKLTCFLVGLLIFPVYIFGGVVCAEGEMNITVKSEMDAALLDSKLSSIGDVDTINIYLETDLKGHSFDFTDDKFSGKTINIIGREPEKVIGQSNASSGGRHKITYSETKFYFLFLTVKNCSVNLNNVELESGDCNRMCGYIKLESPTAGQKTTMNINGSRISNCKNVLDGGALYVGAGATLSVENKTMISHCEASRGGAIFNDGGTVNIPNEGVIIENCRSVYRGGAIFSQGETGVVKLSGAHIENCRSVAGGGAIFLHSGKLKMDRVYIGECDCGFAGMHSGGGAICASAGDNSFAKITMKNSRICCCKSSGSGGAISCSGATRLLIDKESSILSCDALYSGGAIFGTDGARISLKGCKISQCKAFKFGDAVALFKNSELNVDGKSLKVELRFDHGVGVCGHNTKLFNGFDGIYCDDDKSKVSVGVIDDNLDGDFAKPCFGCACF